MEIVIEYGRMRLAFTKHESLVSPENENGVRSMMNGKGTVVEHQESDAGLPWLESLRLRNSIDCVYSCMTHYIHVLIFVWSCSLVHALSTMLRWGGGLNCEAEAHSSLLPPPPPSFSGSRSQKGGA